LESSESRNKTSRKWLRVLQRAAFSAFDAAAPIRLDHPGRAARIASAFRGLRYGFLGYGKQGRILFEALKLPFPETGGVE